MNKKIYISLLLFIAIIAGYFYFKTSLKFTFLNPVYIDKAMIIISVILSTYIFTKILDIFLRKFLLKTFNNANFTKRVFPVFHKILNILIWVIGILIGLGFLGYNPIAIVTGAGVGGVLIAIAGKETISNFVGSIILVFNKNFKIGDKIRIIMKKTYEGTVEEITLSYTKLKDSSGNIIYIPNKNLLLETIENLSQAKFNKIDINLNLSLSNDKIKIDNLIEKLEKNLKKNKLINNYNINLSLENNLINLSIEIFTDLGNNSIKKDISFDIKNEIEKQDLILAQN
ncbi:mechanosensitive ion channel family protein [Candidatus Gracilibacteria bacterium]|nr:mechanosensitive ion channel family protein [Candidatus Gracilibacteria bacterium]